MKFFNFYSKFEDKILAGSKTSTIRKNNYQNIKVGSTVELKCGDKSLKKVKIQQIFDIVFAKDSIMVGGDVLLEDKVEKLLKLEGYSTETRSEFLKNIVEYLGLNITGKLFIW